MKPKKARRKKPSAKKRLYFYSYTSHPMSKLNPKYCSGRGYGMMELDPKTFFASCKCEHSFGPILDKIKADLNDKDSFVHLLALTPLN
jgi:hypothetical protein